MLVGNTERNFDIDLRYGQEGEKLVHDILSGGLRIEVKTDRMAHTTGNLAVEYKCRGKWSGISTTQADWWAFVLCHNSHILMIRTDMLKVLVKIYHNEGMIKRGGDEGLSEFVLVPLEDILYFDHVMLK